MKVARWLMGKFASPHFRRPIRPLPIEEIERLRSELEKLGFECRPISGERTAKKVATRNTTLVPVRGRVRDGEQLQARDGN